MKLIVFDIDGTLLKKSYATNLAYQDTLFQMFGIGNYDRNWDNYHYMTDIGILREIIFSKTDNILKWKEVIEFEKEYTKRYCDILASGVNNNQYFFGAKNMLCNLKENKEWIYAVYTGGLKKVADLKLSSLGIDHHLVPVAYAQDGIDRIDIFRIACDRAKVIYGYDTFDKVVLMGDSRSDVKVSKRFGIPMVGLIGTLCKAEFNDLGISHVLTDYGDYDNFLKIINSI